MQSEPAKNEPIKGKALRRAADSADAYRLSGDVPLITDTTELITPDIAQEMLKKNKCNRPVKWDRVDRYAKIMAADKWRLHGQGIIVDSKGNLINGQIRLYGVIYSGCSVWMRVSRGSPPDTASLIDRGAPQSARDLATRHTERKHSPYEASIARGTCILKGIGKPSTDDVAAELVNSTATLEAIAEEARGTRKTKSVLMILAAILAAAADIERAKALTRQVDALAGKLDEKLLPQTASMAWGKGAAFKFALETALECVTSIGR